MKTPKRTARDRAKYVADRRFALLFSLGAYCRDCGDDDMDVLEFDHHFGRDYDLAKMSRWQRIAVMEREAKAGLITVRCRSCNASRGAKGTLGMQSTGPLFTEADYDTPEIPF